MKTIRTIASSALVAGSGLALLVSCTQQAGLGGTDRATSTTAGGTHGAPVRETVAVVRNEPIPNLPGKRLISNVVHYPPGVSSTPHRHAPSAFIYAYVLSGAVRSAV